MVNRGNGQVTVDIGVRLQVLQSSIEEMQKILDKLKPDSSGFKELSKVIASARKEMDQLQVQTAKPFGSQKQFDKAEKSIDKIDESLEKAQIAVSRLKFSDLKLDASQIDAFKNLQQQINDAKKEYEELKNTTKIDLFSNSAFKNFANSIDPNLISKNFDQVVNIVEKKIDAINRALDTARNNLNKTTAQIQIGQNIRDFIKKGGISAKSLGPETFSQIFTKKSDFKAGGKGIFFEYLKEQFSISDDQLNQLKNLSAKKIQTLISDEGFWKLQLDAANKANTGQANLRTEVKRLTDEQREAAAAGTVLANAQSTVGAKSKEVQATTENVNKRVKELEQNYTNAARNSQTFNNGLNSGRAQLESFRNTLEQTNVQFLKLQQQQQTFNSIKMAITNFMGFTQVLNLTKRAVKEAMNHIKELDTVMNGISIVTDMTTKDLWKQVDMYSEMAQSYGTTIKGAYEVSKIYYQAGYETNDVLTLMNETLKMSKISGLDYATTTDYMMNALRGFKLEVEDAARVVDVYSGLAQNTAVSQQELAEAMSKTASSMEGVGSTFEETSAMIATMVAVTRETANNIGSAMKSIASRYGELTKDPIKLFDAEGEAMSFNKVDTALKSVGITLQTTDHQFRSFTDVILELSDVWDTLTSAQQRYIATQFAGNRQQNRFLALVGNKELLQENLDVANNSEDVGTIQALKSLDSLESKLNQVEVAYQQFYTTIGAENVWKFLLDGAENFINNLNTLPKLFNVIPISAVGVIADAVILIKDLALKGLSMIASEFKHAVDNELHKVGESVKSQSEQTGREAIEGFNRGVQSASGNEVKIVTQEQVDDAKNKAQQIKEAFEQVQPFSAVNFGDSSAMGEEMLRYFNETLEGLVSHLQETGAISEQTAEKLRNLAPQEAILRLNILNASAQNTARTLQNELVQSATQANAALAQNRSITAKIGNFMADNSSKISNYAMAINVLANFLNNGTRAGERFAGALMGVSGAMNLALGFSTGDPLKIIRGIISLISGVSTFIETTQEKIERLTKEAEELNNEAKIAKADYNSLQRTADKLDELKEKRYENAEAEQEYQAAVEELAKKMPGLITGMDKAGNATIDVSNLESELAKMRESSTEATIKAIKAELLKAETEEELAEKNKKQAKQNIQNNAGDWARGISFEVNASATRDVQNATISMDDLTEKLSHSAYGGSTIEESFNNIFAAMVSNYANAPTDINDAGKTFEEIFNEILSPNNIGGYDIHNVEKLKTILSNYEETENELLKGAMPYLQVYLDNLTSILPENESIVKGKIDELQKKLNELSDKKTDEEFDQAINDIITLISSYGLEKYLDPNMLSQIYEAINNYQGVSRENVVSKDNLRALEKMTVSSVIDKLYSSQVEFLEDQSLLNNYILKNYDEWKANGNTGDIEDYLATFGSTDINKFNQSFDNNEDWRKFNKYWADRDNYSLSDWTLLFPNVENTELWEELKTYYGENNKFSKAIISFNDSVTNAANNYIEQGYSKTAENLKEAAQGVTNALNDTPIENKSIISNVLKNMTLTQEGVDNAIKELESIEGSEKVISALNELRDKFIINLPLTIQAATEELMTQIDEAGDQIKKVNKGFKPTEISGIIQKINEYRAKNNEALLTVSELTQKKGVFYLPADAVEDYYQAIYDELSAASNQIKQDVQALLAPESEETQALNHLTALLKTANHNPELLFNENNINEQALAWLEQYGLIERFVNEINGQEVRQFKFTEKARGLGENIGFTFSNFVEDSLNTELATVEAGLESISAIKKDAGIEADKEYQDTYNAAISELGLTVGERISEDTRKILEAAGIIGENSAFKVDENNYIKAIGNRAENYSKLYDYGEQINEANSKENKAVLATEATLNELSDKIVSSATEAQNIEKDVYQQLVNWDKNSGPINISQLHITDEMQSQLDELGVKIENGVLYPIKGKINQVLDIFEKEFNIDNKTKTERTKKAYEDSPDYYLNKLFSDINKIDQFTAQYLADNIEGLDIDFFGELDGTNYNLTSSKAIELMGIVQKAGIELLDSTDASFKKMLEERGKTYVDFANKIPELYEGYNKLTEEEYEILKEYLTDFGYDAEKIGSTYYVTSIPKTSEEVANAVEAVSSAINTQNLATVEEQRKLYDQIWELRNKNKTAAEDVIKKLQDMKQGETIHLTDLDQIQLLNQLNDEELKQLEATGITYNKETAELTLNEASGDAAALFIGNWIGLLSQELLELAVNAKQSEFDNSAEKVFLDALSDLDNISYELASFIAERLGIDENSDEFRALFTEAGGHYKANASLINLITQYYEDINEEIPYYISNAILDTTNIIIDKFRTAGSQLDGGVGDEVNEEAASILLKAGYSIKQIGSKYFITGVGDVVQAYEEFYYTISRNNSFTAQEVKDARKQLVDAFNAEREKGFSIIKDLGNIDSLGSWIDFSDVLEILDKGRLNKLSKDLAKAGATLEDGIIKTFDSTNLIQANEAALKSLQEQLGKELNSAKPDQNDINRLKDLITETQDSITNVIKDYIGLISDGIKGSLSVEKMTQLENFAQTYGLEIDFNKTEEGLKLSQKSAMDLYLTMKDVDYLQSRVLFKDLSDNLKESSSAYQDVVSIQGHIAKLQKEINNLPVGSARRQEYEKELAVAKEIRDVRSLTDEDAFNFMDRDLPTPYKAGLGYWDSVGKMFKEMNDAAESGYMDVTNFYNMVNGMNEMAQNMGHSITFMGMELDGSMESASKVIQKGFNSLANVDGTGAKVSMEKMGAGIYEGALGMQSGAEKGIKEFAKTQIKMLDAMIAFLEVVVAFEDFDKLDIDSDGLEFDEVFETLKDGSIHVKENAQSLAKNMLDAAKTNPDLMKGLKGVKINGTSMYKMMQELATDSVKSKDLMDKYYKNLSIMVKAAKDGDFSTENLTKLIQEAYGGSDELIQVDVFDRHFAIKGDVVIEKDENGNYVVDGKKYTSAKLAIAAQTAKDKLGLEKVVAEENGRVRGHLTVDGKYDVEVITSVRHPDKVDKYVINDKSYATRDEAINALYKEATGKEFDPDDPSSQRWILESDAGVTLGMSLQDIEIKSGKNLGEWTQEQLEKHGINTEIATGVKAGIQSAFEDPEFSLGKIIIDSLMGSEKEQKNFNDRVTETIKKSAGIGKNTRLRFDNEPLLNFGIQLADGILLGLKAGISDPKTKELNISNILLDGLLGSKDKNGEYKDNSKLQAVGEQLGKGLMEAMGSGLSTNQNGTEEGTFASKMIGAINLAKDNAKPVIDDTMLLFGLSAIEKFKQGFTMVGDDGESSFDQYFIQPFMNLINDSLVGEMINAGINALNNFKQGFSMIGDDGESSISQYFVQPFANLINDSLSGEMITTGINSLEKFKQGFTFTDDEGKSSMTEMFSRPFIELIEADLAGEQMLNVGKNAVETFISGFTKGSEEEDANGAKTVAEKITKPIRTALEELFTKETLDKLVKDFETNSTIKLSFDSIDVGNLTTATEGIATAIKTATEALDTLKTSIDKIESKEVTFSAKLKGEASTSMSAHVESNGVVTVTADAGSPTATASIMRSYAKGNVALVKGRNTLMGELGPELYVTGGRYYVAGQNGAEMVDLPDDAIVFNHLQTKKLLGTGHAGRGKAVTNEKKATSFATGNVNGPAMASARDTLAQLKAMRAMFESMLNASFKDLGGLAKSSKDTEKSKSNKDSTDDNTDKETELRLSRIVEDVERWYNLERQIAKLEKDISYSEKLINKYQQDRVANGDEIYNTYKTQLKLLDSTIDKNRELVQVQRDWYDEKRAELENSVYGLFISYDENGLQQLKNLDILEQLQEETIEGEGINNSYSVREQVTLLGSLGADLRSLLYDESDVTKYSGMNSLYEIYGSEGQLLEGQDLYDAWAKIMENFYSHLEDWKTTMDSSYDGMHETEEKIVDELNQQNSILQGLVDNQIEVENAVLEAIVDSREAEIDELQKTRDAYEDSVNKMVDGLNEALDKEREMYKSEEERTELTKLQRQLAILQRSGGSASQIRSLQNQITSKQQDMYFDTREKEIEAIQDAADKQIERMDTQIDLMTETLEYQKEYGLLWDQVYQIMALSNEDILGFITENGANWKSESHLQKEEDIRSLLEQIQVWTKTRDDEELEQISEKANNASVTTANRDESVFSKTEKKELKPWEDSISAPVEEIIADLDNLDAIKTNASTSNQTTNSSNDSNNISADSLKGQTAKMAKKYTGTEYVTDQSRGWEQHPVQFTISKGASVKIIKELKKGYRIKAPDGNVYDVPKEYVQFKNGGLVDFTGPAWVDGSKSEPEAILNNKQLNSAQNTLQQIKELKAMWDAQIQESIFMQQKSLTNSLRNELALLDEQIESSRGNNTNNTESGNIYIETVELNMNAQINDGYSAKRAGQQVFDEFIHLARKNGVNSISRR